MRKSASIIVLLCGLVLAGCSAAAAVRPVTARDLLLRNPAVAGWYTGHSAPAVLTELTPKEARRWRNYRPAVTVDLVKEGLQVRMESRFGPAPRKLEALMDRETGKVLSVTWR